MKKEDADQLIRCIKECWWRIAVLLLLGLVGVLLAVNGRPAGGWSMEWSAVAALATLLAAVIALGLGLGQFIYLLSVKKHEAKVVGTFLYPILAKTSGALEACRDGTYPGRPDSDGWKIAVSGLWSIQRISIHEVILYANGDPVGGKVLAETINLFVSTIESKGLPRNYDENYNYDLFIERMKSEGLQESLDVIKHNMDALVERMLAMRN